ncbi:hypothetical protein [Streptococcus porci]|uniref:hypothetical protein n=1 Tax=Streptococcus porci TaxID=502567 RepID=UPI0004194204|nr:hypothetical protein [Streptococcus porci]
MRITKQRKDGYGRIGCAMEYENEITEIADKTGMTKTAIVNALLGFALAHSELIVEERTIEVHSFKIGEEMFDEYNNQ